MLYEVITRNRFARDLHDILGHSLTDNMFGDRIALDGKPVKVRIIPPPPRVLAYHKPVGEVSYNFV